MRDREDGGRGAETETQRHRKFSFLFSREIHRNLDDFCVSPPSLQTSRISKNRGGIPRNREGGDRQKSSLSTDEENKYSTKIEERERAREREREREKERKRDRERIREKEKEKKEERGRKRGT